MAGGREIRTKIKSVQNTRKVTKALEMVSASKIRRSQDQMESSRPYSRMMRKLIGHVAKANAEYVHPFMEERTEIKNVGYIMISSDRGLCGGLNSNLIKTVVTDMRKQQENGVDCKMVTLGNKGNSFFKNVAIDIIAHKGHLSETPEIADLIGVVKVMLDAYRKGEVDQVFICFNDFVNTMTQKPTVEQLLPLKGEEDEELKDRWDYLYEPDPQTVLDEVMVRYVESLVYQSLVENIACEHAARMIAMKNASDNASSLIEDLQLVYNKARQAAITQEISEIVGGAAAL